MWSQSLYTDLGHESLVSVKASLSSADAVLQEGMTTQRTQSASPSKSTSSKSTSLEPTVSKSVDSARERERLVNAGGRRCARGPDSEEDAERVTLEIDHLKIDVVGTNSVERRRQARERERLVDAGGCRRARGLDSAEGAERVTIEIDLLEIDALGDRQCRGTSSELVSVTASLSPAVAVVQEGVTTPRAQSATPSKSTSSNSTPLETSGVEVRRQALERKSLDVAGGRRRVRGHDDAEDAALSRRRPRKSRP